MSDVFRKEYRQLNPDEVATMKAIKEKAQELYDMLTGYRGGDNMGGALPAPGQLLVPGSYEAEDGPHVIAINPRCQATAKTKLEECVMWATKGITG